MNLSLGGPRNLILEAAIGRVLGAGIPVVAAAGNDGPDAPPVYPAAQEGVIAVTAVDADRRVYRKANRGDYIRFAAPGVDVPVPRMDQEAYVSGTSFAAPLVTAALVAARQAGPARPWPDVIRQLEQAAQDLGAPGRDATFGAGLVQGPAQCGNPG
jgi:subtilisin family serine protease